jgi:hypothetical protein
MTMEKEFIVGKSGKFFVFRWMLVWICYGKRNEKGNEKAKHQSIFLGHFRHFPKPIAGFYVFVMLQVISFYIGGVFGD